MISLFRQIPRKITALESNREAWSTVQLIYWSSVCNSKSVRGFGGKLFDKGRSLAGLRCFSQLFANFRGAVWKNQKTADSVREILRFRFYFFFKGALWRHRIWLREKTLLLFQKMVEEGGWQRAGGEDTEIPEPDFNDPEGFVDDISNEELLPDMMAKVPSILALKREYELFSRRREKLMGSKTWWLSTAFQKRKKSRSWKKNSMEFGQKWLVSRSTRSFRLKWHRRKLVLRFLYYLEN